jgi:putative transposase
MPACGFPHALAESFVDSFKTELIADRVWRSRAQLELATVEYIAWFNTARVHSSLGYLTPADVEERYRAQPVELRAGPAKTAITVIEDWNPPAGLYAE